MFKGTAEVGTKVQSGHCSNRSGVYYSTMMDTTGNGKLLRVPVPTSPSHGTAIDCFLAWQGALLVYLAPVSRHPNFFKLFVLSCLYSNIFHLIVFCVSTVICGHWQKNNDNFEPNQNFHTILFSHWQLSN